MIFCGCQNGRGSAMSNYKYQLSSGTPLIGKKRMRFTIEYGFSYGGNGEVYNIKEKNIDKNPIVVKYFRCSKGDNRKTRWERFREEINFLIKYKNVFRNIPEILDYSCGENEHSSAWFAMPKYSKFSDGSKKSIKEKIEEFIDIIDIVKQFHEKEIMHRDIKMSNLLRDGDKIIVADYGLILYSNSLNKKRRTNEGEFVGSFYYAPPELRNERPNANEIEARTDLYLISKTQWAYITNSLNPFIGQFDKYHCDDIYNLVKMTSITSVEPLIEFFESTTKNFVGDRITIDLAKELLVDQISIIDNNISLEKRNKYMHSEMAREVEMKYDPEIKAYSEKAAVVFIMNSCINKFLFNVSTDYKRSWSQIGNISTSGQKINVDLNRVTIVCDPIECVIKNDKVQFELSVLEVNGTNYYENVEINQKIYIETY